jgi:hypothetical protein
MGVENCAVYTPTNLSPGIDPRAARNPPQTVKTNTQIDWNHNRKLLMVLPVLYAVGRPGRAAVKPVL